MLVHLLFEILDKFLRQRILEKREVNPSMSDSQLYSGLNVKQLILSMLNMDIE